MRYELLHIGNLKDLQELNDRSLPMSYEYQFYSDLLAQNSSHVTLIGYVGDSAVAAICIVKINGDLYVKTITVSPSLQGRGLGSQIFYKGIDVAKPPPGASIYLHVWVKNIVACQFYTSLGFEIVKLEPSYYSRLSPSSAWELKSTAEQIKRKPQKPLGQESNSSPRSISYLLGQGMWRHTSNNQPYQDPYSKSPYAQGEPNLWTMKTRQV